MSLQPAAVNEAHSAASAAALAAAKACAPALFIEREHASKQLAPNPTDTQSASDAHAR